MSDTPQDAAQSRALKDAQTRAKYCEGEQARCQYRIAQESDGSIKIKVNYDYMDPQGRCGGDLYEEWKYSSAGDLIETT